MNKAELEQLLSKIDLKPGKLLKIKSEKKIFWIDGINPAIVQSLLDDDGKVVQEYISGGNHWEKVESGEILLFLGVAPIQVRPDDPDLGLKHDEYFAMKWLFRNKVLFWTLDGIVNAHKLEEVFEIVGEREIPS